MERNNNGKKATPESNDVKKKVEATRKEWSKEWELEKQTEGLDKNQAEAPKK